MFEKEAEEYLKTDGTKAEQIFNMLNEISPLKITSTQATFIIAMIKQTFQDGAEFGYNKANEWHYVKDGDLPKENKDCLVVFHNKYSDNIVKSISRYSVELKKWWFIHNLEDMEEDVIAWKEIVLPELPKESE